MIDEITLARVICRANLQKKIEGFIASGDATTTMEPGLVAMLERDVLKHWPAYLPEARAVIKEIERK